MKTKIDGKKVIKKVKIEYILAVILTAIIVIIFLSGSFDFSIISNDNKTQNYQTELENKLEGVKNYKITVKELNGKIVFLRRITQGSANKSFGIEVASLAGVPSEVTQRAKKILRLLEKNDLTYSFKEETTQGAAVRPSFADNYLKELDLNNITPLKAFEILAFLKEKSNEDN